MRTTRFFERMSGSLWLLPVVLACLGIALGLLLPWLDRQPAVLRAAEQPFVEALVASTPEGAHEILGTAAGALSTILGVVFSLTVVTLQLASRQYTPRVLRRFMADRTTQLILGIFVGSVAYLLLVLRAVETSTDDDPGFVPAFSLSFGIVLAIANLALVAYFVHHLSESIQASKLCSAIGEGARADLRSIELRADPPVELPKGPPALVRARSSGYLMLVDEEQLCEVAPEGCVIRIEAHTGDFVLEGMPLASIWPLSALEPATRRHVRAAFALGRERSTRQDLLFSVRQLVDVALKGLSPGINDPTTAVMAVNELGSLLRDVVRQAPPVRSGYRCVASGETRVLVPALGLEDYLAHSFTEIVEAAGEHPRITARILELLGEVAEQAPRQELRHALQAEGRRLFLLGGGEKMRPVDRLLLERRLGWLEAGGMLRTELHDEGPLVH
ncbi:DUF2254 domain-containing protein [Vulgatibacter sp.]|uniref:DUF2254 domain-containing protein n=1 Tax=Vulgatibacter sp. TaxID=1971226 RepID=UPI00356461BD